MATVPNSITHTLPATFTVSNDSSNSVIVLSNNVIGSNKALYPLYMPIYMSVSFGVDPAGVHSTLASWSNSPYYNSISPAAGKYRFYGSNSNAQFTSIYSSGGIASTGAMTAQTGDGTSFALVIITLGFNSSIC